jgi:hypothetical protein
VVTPYSLTPGVTGVTRSTSSYPVPFSSVHSNSSSTPAKLKPIASIAHPLARALPVPQLTLSGFGMLELLTVPQRSNYQ